MEKIVSPGFLSGTLRMLPSKSASHRAVMMAAMAQGKTLLEPLQLSQDISATLSCAEALGLTDGAAIAPTDTEGFVRAEIHGGGMAENRELRVLDCGESGSTLRFFIPLALDGRGAVRFEGRGRLMQRPLSVYEDMFKARGILWRHEGDSLTVDGLLESGRYSMPGDVSSQFITGMLLALPRLEGDSVLEITTPLESRAYVELTRRIQADYHVVSEWDEKGQSLLIPGGQRAVSPGRMHIGGDWSHAAFYLVAGAIGRGEIRLTGLDPNSAQGDRALSAFCATWARTSGGRAMSWSSAHRSCMGCTRIARRFPTSFRLWLWRWRRRRARAASAARRVCASRKATGSARCARRCPQRVRAFAKRRTAC